VSEDTVLLTGATGFLGMELLVRLLERTDSELIVLIRACDRNEAAARLSGVFDRLYDTLPAAAAERVQAIPADVSLDGLGLDPGDRRELLARTRSIVHCAASIAFDLPLAQARNTNARGAERMLDLAEELHSHGRLRRMVHVSTAYVCGTHAGVFTEEDLDVGQRFRNTYERSKAEGERTLCSRAAQLPLVVARPSIVVGDSRCGWTPSFNVIYWPLQAFARGLIGELPADPDGVLDIVPVDYVADAILALHEDPRASGTVNLVAGADAARNHRIAELACEHFARPAPRFARDAALRSSTEGELYLPYFDVRAQFDNRRALELLAPRGITCPPVDRYFSTLMSHAQRARWGKLSPTRESVHAAPGQRSAAPVDFGSEAKETVPRHERRSRQEQRL
jgi:thioester reductase-like protein